MAKGGGYSQYPDGPVRACLLVNSTPGPLRFARHIFTVVGDYVGRAETRIPDPRVSSTFARFSGLRILSVLPKVWRCIDKKPNRLWVCSKVRASRVLTTTTSGDQQHGLRTTWITRMRVERTGYGTDSFIRRVVVEAWKTIQTAFTIRMSRFWTVARGTTAQRGYDVRYGIPVSRLRCGG